MEIKIEKVSDFQRVKDQKWDSIKEDLEKQMIDALNKLLKPILNRSGGITITAEDVFEPTQSSSGKRACFELSLNIQTKILKSGKLIIKLGHDVDGNNLDDFNFEEQVLTLFAIGSPYEEMEFQLSIANIYEEYGYNGPESVQFKVDEQEIKIQMIERTNIRNIPDSVYELSKLPATTSLTSFIDKFSEMAEAYLIKEASNK